MHCKDCRFWLAEGFSAEAIADDVESELGDCRRHAPQPVLGYFGDDGEARELAAYWPLTLATEWCGEFEAKQQLQPGVFGAHE